MQFPSAVPEIPVSSIDQALVYYVGVLGFQLDWGDEQGGIAGLSRGDCRLFLTNAAFRGTLGNNGPVLIWLNFNSKSEVDEIFREWQAVGARLLSEPEDKLWKLREFVASDPDGNLIRAFYDFSNEI